MTHLGSGADAKFEYSVEARKRGYYPIGPLSVSTGDILGLSDSLLAQNQAEPCGLSKDHSIHLHGNPILFAAGDVTPHLPLFEDPTRVFGKRGYLSGEFLRRIDWKSSAVCGPAAGQAFRAIDCARNIYRLNLNAEDYYYRTRIDLTELAIVIAASISNWIVRQKADGRDDGKWSRPTGG